MDTLKTVVSNCRNAHNSIPVRNIWYGNDIVHYKADVFVKAYG